MTSGRQLRYLAVALGLLVVGAGVCSVREHMPTVLVVLLVGAVVAAVVVLVGSARRKR